MSPLLTASAPGGTPAPVASGANGDRARIVARVDGELGADTEAGARMVAAAERFAARFADAALAKDRHGTFAVAHLEALRTERYLVAPIPVDLGGGGVGSVHDVLVAMSRLARGDAATSIGVNMHFAVLLNGLRRLATDTAAGRSRGAEAGRGVLAAIAGHDVVFAAAASEPAPQDLTRPATRATRTADGGWRIDGRKVFATMAPYATLLNVAVTFTGDDGTERYGFATVAPGAPGVRFAGDWDALGMRASESGSVTFTDVRIAADALRDGFAAGVQSAELLERYLVSGAFHAASALGVAESAQERIVATLRRSAVHAAADPFTVTQLAANVTDLAAMRATFDRAARAIDLHHADHPLGDPGLDVAQVVYAEVQAAKAVVTAGAARVTDRALALSGGAGFTATHPLAKAWRDARAGAFMHPIGANRADVLLARTALGLPPA